MDEPKDCYVVFGDRRIDLSHARVAFIDGELVEIGEFDACMLVANKRNLTNLDIEPWAGCVTVTATKPDGTPVKVKAETLLEASRSFIARSR